MKLHSIVHIAQVNLSSLGWHPISKACSIFLFLSHFTFVNLGICAKENKRDRNRQRDMVIGRKCMCTVFCCLWFQQILEIKIFVKPFNFWQTRDWIEVLTSNPLLYEVWVLRRLRYKKYDIWFDDCRMKAKKKFCYNIYLSIFEDYHKYCTSQFYFGATLSTIKLKLNQKEY